MALVGDPISVETGEWLCQRNQGICTGWKAVPSHETAPAKIDRLGEIRPCLQSSAPIITGLVGPHPNAVRKPCVPMNSFDLPAVDLYAEAISRLQACKDSSISIPELSSLLRVKSTTLNARLRRQHIAVRTEGRTNFVPGVLALQLAELHKHALIGWPTLRQASEISGVKVGTIKARCEKGQLRSYRDLTKRLRINPSELDGLHLRLRTTKPASGEARFKAPTRPPLVQGMRQTTGTVYLEHGGIRKAPRSSASGEVQTKCREIGWPESNLVPADPFNKPQIDQGGVRTPLRAVPVNPPIKVISRRDYGLPEVENPSSLRAGQTKQPQRQGRTTGFLSYNPDKPFSIAACAVGKTVRYDDYDGTIVGIVDDPFSPQIKVRFAAHHNPLMREVLLIVGRRRMAEQARDLRLERNPL